MGYLLYNVVLVVQCCGDGVAETSDAMMRVVVDVWWILAAKH